MLTATCPHCGFSGSVPPSKQGKSIRCPRCKESFCVGGDEPVGKPEAVEAPAIEEHIPDEELPAPSGSRESSEEDPHTCQSKGDNMSEQLDELEETAVAKSAWKFDPKHLPSMGKVARGISAACFVGVACLMILDVGLYMIATLLSDSLNLNGYLTLLKFVFMSVSLTGFLVVNGFIFWIVANHLEVLFPEERRSGAAPPTLP